MSPNPEFAIDLGEVKNGPSPASPWASRITRVLIAVILGVYLVVTPMVLLFLSGVFLAPSLIWTLCDKGARHGIELVLGIVLAIVLVAMAAPVKDRERVLNRPVPLPSRGMTLGQLAELRDPRIIMWYDRTDQDHDRFLHFPSDQPSLRQIMQAIETQTECVCYLPRGCGNSTTILWGTPSPSSFSVNRPDPDSPETEDGLDTIKRSTDQTKHLGVVP